ncbi:MAG: hypothetical protein Q8O38_06335 [Sulfurimicrobium sp.]|nr:hypothetical protein [Sulfurimicrobium sp.]
MFGMIVFGLLGIYLLLLVWATRRGWRWGIEKKAGRGASVIWVWQSDS